MAGSVPAEDGSGKSSAMWPNCVVIALALKALDGRLPGLQAVTRPQPASLCSGGMPGPFFDASERARRSDLFDELGPDAPTLLAPWTTRDIAAHLVLREHDPLAGPGLVLPEAWRRLAERRQMELAARDFAGLVATFRSGPPPGFSASDGCVGSRA